MAEVVKKLSSLALAVAGSFALTACTQMHPVGQSPQAARFGRQIALEHQWWNMRWQARNRTLADLTPAHRQLVGQLIGQLAVEPQPNTRQAIDLLDKTLTKEEKNSILDESAWLRKRSQPFFDWKYQQLATTEPFVHFDTILARKMHEDPGASLLLLTTNSIALNTSLEARQLLLERAQRSRMK
jgi:hypothetical protein